MSSPDFSPEIRPRQKKRERHQHSKNKAKATFIADNDLYKSGEGEKAGKYNPRKSAEEDLAYLRSLKKPPGRNR